MDEEKFESQLNKLNANFLDDSKNMFGLRNGFQFGEEQINGCITNETREDLIKLQNLLDKQPELQKIVNK